MREYNQLTAAGSYGERMILNRNQYKLNLTLSSAEQSSELEIRRGGERRQAWGDRGVPGRPPQQQTPGQAASLTSPTAA